MISAKRGLVWECCRAKPLRSHVSILRGTCPTVVDHMQRIRAAWKNSIDWGATRSVLETSERAHSYNFGARLAASSSEVYRTAIRQQAQKSKGALLTRGRRGTGSDSGSHMIQLP